MVATYNKGAPAAYYRQTLAYYATGISSFWFAPDNRLGVLDGAPVDFGAFENLYAGLDAHGNSLARNTGGHTLSRVPAFDITLSPDKTFGIVRAFAGPELGAAMDQLLVDASCDSLTVGQDLGGWRRRGKGGMRLDPVSLTAAVFAHTDSRPALHADGETFSDMNPHLHAVVFNSCVSADGSAGSLHSVLLRRSKMAVGAAFHASLAAGLAELGFVIEETGPNGLFQIAGISPELVQYFSSRRNEIEDALAEAGTTSAQSPALAANAAERTRQTKVSYTEEEQREIWRAACTRLGFDPDKIVGQALAVSALPAAISGEELYKQRLSALVQELTESEAVFSAFDLKRATLAALVGTGLPVSRAQNAEDELMGLGMVQVGVDALGLAVFSTKEMVRTEMSVVALARDLSRASGFALDPAVVAEACAKKGLSEEQTDAALAATQSGRICLIEGAPGSGKSTTLAVPASCYQAAGCKVVAAATAWKIAKGLGEDLGVEAKATAAWLAALKRGEKVFDDKTVLVVDEVGLLSGGDTEGLLQAATDAGAKIILVGDRQQLRPIGSGSGLELVARSVGTNRIDTIVRQHDEWARQMVRDLGAGRADAGLAALGERGDLLFARDVNAAVAEVVNLRRKRVEAGVEPLILARSNAQVRKIASEIRKDRRAAGELGEDVVEFTGRANDRTFAMSLAVGDRVRFNVKDDDLGVVNGSTAQITTIEPAADPLATVLVALFDGREIRFTLGDFANDKGHVALTWSYASTIFASQGMTVDETIVLGDAGFDRSACYVAASRARRRTTVVVDRSSLECLDQFEPGPTDTLKARLVSVLAERWARNPKKTSTLDYIDPAQWQHLVAKPETGPIASEMPSPWEPDYV